MDLDLTQATTVKKSSVQRQDFDLRYKYSNGKFQLSDTFYAEKGMDNHGLTLHFVKNKAGETVVVLSIRPNEESIFYKGKKGDAPKDPNFSYSLLASSLKNHGLIGEKDAKGFENFRLEFVGKNEGFDYYKISPWGEEKGEEKESSDENTADAEAETEQDKVSEEGKAAPAPEAEQKEEAKASEEGEAELDDDPFAL